MAIYIFSFPCGCLCLCVFATVMVATAPHVTVTAADCCLWAAHKKWSRQLHQLISGNGLRRELEWKSTCNLVGRQCV